MCLIVQKLKESEVMEYSSLICQAYCPIEKKLPVDTGTVNKTC